MIPLLSPISSETRCIFVSSADTECINAMTPYLRHIAWQFLLALLWPCHRPQVRKFLPSVTMLIHLVSLISLLASALANTHGWPEPWPSHWRELNSDLFPGQQVPLTVEDTDADAGCRLSNITAFEMAKGRKIVDFTTKAIGSLEEPKIQPLNSSGGEQWEFDGVSEDGMQSFVFGFYRDANYAILGTGNFRLSIEFAFADRTRFYEVYYPERSVVETCSQGTRGLWVDEKNGYRFSFQVDADMTEAIITLDSDTVKGKVSIRSQALPLTADGSVWPAENASTAPIPYYHWSQPIPAGTVDTDVEIKGKRVQWTGMGGHERFWSAFRSVTSHVIWYLVLSRPTNPSLPI